MVEPSFGLVFGFTVFLFIVAVFILGLIIYFLYNYCRKKKSKLNDDIEKEDIQEIKTEADGASWESPMTDLDEAISYAENSLPRDHEKDNIEQGIANPVIPEEVEEPEEREPTPILQEQEPENNIMAISEPEERENHENVNYGFDRTFSGQSDGNVYATIKDSQQNSLSEQEKEKPKVGKLHHRVSIYESNVQSSLIRPSKRTELEGIKNRAVSGLVTEYEASDSILLGRQLTAADPGSSYKPQYSMVKPNNTDLAHDTRNSIVDSGSRNSFMDSDTGEPLYSVPNLAKKSSRKSDRPKPTVDKREDREEADGDESDIISPGVPPKNIEF